ncbi:hypothetical protein V494_07625 [Pseudogymnoascus sp. VKM F-4513 (FW-928)]|nr:hypothetical protein V494_07625 [Pseudogymnoascus sp. VKM F-4513 (FW-928)]
MKTSTLSLAAISLLQLAVAQPHRRHAHEAFHAKKDVTVRDDSSVARVIVYVDQNGNAVSTSTQLPAAQTEAPVAPAAPSPTPEAAAPIVADKAVDTNPSSASSESAPSPSASSGSDSSAPSTGGYGLTYSPYNKDGSCKTADQVLMDFGGFGSGYSTVRTYGIDCDTVSTVVAAAKAHGMKVFQGIFDIADIAGSVKEIVSAVNGDWSTIHTISVGNELVNSGKSSASAVVDAMSAARKQLRAAGYNGPVVTCDTLVATLANPSLCDNADYCAVNSHPFFDPNTDATSAGKFLTTSIESLKSKLADSAQNIVITETGWPSKGSTNGLAIPSSSNQKAAISAIKSAFESAPDNVMLFNPYNMMWKTSTADQFEAEQWWGFLGECPSG